jgi:cytochrome P450
MACPYRSSTDHLPSDRVIPFNFRSAAGLSTDPWSQLHALNNAPSLFFSPELGGHWCAVRREVVVEILRNSDVFSTKQVRVPPLERDVPSIPHHLDPPQHGKYRLSVVELFGHRVLDRLSGDIRETARRLANEMVAKTSGEFVRDFAMRMPIEIFMRLCGLPLDRRDELTAWVHAFFHGNSVEEANEAHRKTVTFLGTWLDDYLKPGDAKESYIMSSLLKARVDGRPLNRDEMMAIVITLFNGGLDTVAAQMTHIVRWMAEHPVERQQLIEHPDTIPGAVEELLRRHSIISIGRLVKRDTEFHGMPLREGQMVLCLISAAGLDESEFPNAMTVDFSRANRTRHCAFGSGAHMCVGAPLARLELKIMLEELLPRVPNLRIAPGAQISYYTGVTLGLHNLPLEWDAA